MQRLIDKNIHETKNDNIICKSDNDETLYFNCNDRCFFKIDLEDQRYEDELTTETGLIKHCDYILCSNELEDIVIWIELKSQDRHGKINDIKEQLSQVINRFGQNIKKHYAAVIFSYFEHHRSNPNAKTALQDLQSEWEEDNKKLFIREKTMNLQYNSNNQTISTC